MTSTATNMYRVGDYVYFEINSSSPYQIRRIEELNKTPTGNVEAKVMCFYRRRDISSALTKIFEDRPATTITQNSFSTQSDNENSVELKPPTAGASVIIKDEPAAASTISIEQPPTETTISGSTSNSRPTSPAAIPMETSETAPADGSDSAAVVPTVTSDSDVIADKSATTTMTSSADDVTAPAAADSTDATIIAASSAPPTSEAANSNAAEEAVPPASSAPSTTTNGGFPSKTTIRMPGEEHLSDPEKHQLLHHELFLSRQIETLPATHIRGKCSVTLLNEIETPHSYLGHDDMFFYSLVYDPTQKTLIADKGEIRTGEKYQADIPDMLAEDEKDAYRREILETLIFHPYHSLTDRKIDEFIVIARAVGTFARALDMGSSAKQPNLHLTAAAASRDVTPFQAMALLHQADYDLNKAMSFLVPQANKQCYPIEADKATALNTSTLGGPLMCRDQLEEWSAAEANLFDEALEKYGKDFNDIRQDFLPWKALRDIVEYYYMWKTTDRYVQQKRVKASEAESRLKQVYIPAYTKPNPNALNSNNTVLAQSTKNCEGCSADHSEQWYSWGPPGSFLRLCKECWTYWKKFGGLKCPHPMENFDKAVYSLPEQITNIVPRPSDRLEAFDVHSAIRRCAIGGCGRQFANLQLLNQHMRRDHFINNDGGDGAAADGVLGPSAAAALLGAAAAAGGQLGFSGGQLGLAAASVGGGGGHHHHLAAHHHGLDGRQLHHGAGGGHFNSHVGPSGRPGAPRTRTSFYIRTTLVTKVARRLAPKPLLNVKRVARNPFDPINMLAIKQNYQQQPHYQIRQALRALVKNLPATVPVTAMTTHHHNQPAQAQVTHQQGHPHQQQQSVVVNPSYAKSAVIAQQPSAAAGTGFPQKRTQNGMSWDSAGPAAKKSKTGELERGDPLFLKWIRTPDDCYFHSTKQTRLVKRNVSNVELRRAGRRPYKTPQFVLSVFDRF